MTTRILGGKGNRTRRSQKASCRATTSRRPPTRYERSHTRKVNLCIIQVKDNGGGRIINIGSGCNKVGFPNLVSYTASKGGIEMFTKVAAVELGPLGITVNCVAPGAVEIERTKLEAPDYAATWAPLTPMRRVGNPGDVAAAVCYLAADEAEFVSGQTLFVDGGLFSRGPWAYDDE